MAREAALRAFNPSMAYENMRLTDLFDGPTKEIKPKETKMKKLVRSIMMLCTGLCFAGLMVLLHPFVAMIPRGPEGRELPVAVMWCGIVIAGISLSGFVYFASLVLSSLYDWVFGESKK